MRHAWLIIAHNEFDILQMLVSALDDSESDFYIHIDKKVKIVPSIRAKKGRIEILKDRIDARWGDVSLIKAEFALFEAAVNKGNYSYYHIVSGTTLPLKSVADINVFFSSVGGKSVVTGLSMDDSYQETLKCHRYNLFIRNMNSSSVVCRRVSQFFWKVSIAVQRMLNIYTNKEKTFYKASQWLSLTKEAAELLVSRKDKILKTYRWSFCGDEYFVPSELMDSPLKEEVYNSDNYLMHTMGRANAGTYHLSEWEELSKTDYLFARKFTR